MIGNWSFPPTRMVTSITRFIVLQNCNEFIEINNQVGVYIDIQQRTILLKDVDFFKYNKKLLGQVSELRF